MINDKWSHFSYLFITIQIPLLYRTSKTSERSKHTQKNRLLYERKLREAREVRRQVALIQKRLSPKL